MGLAQAELRERSGRGYVWLKDWTPPTMIYVASEASRVSGRTQRAEPRVRMLFPLFVVLKTKRMQTTVVVVFLRFLILF